MVVYSRFHYAYACMYLTVKYCMGRRSCRGDLRYMYNRALKNIPRAQQHDSIGSVTDDFQLNTKIMCHIKNYSTQIYNVSYTNVYIDCHKGQLHYSFLIKSMSSCVIYKSTLSSTVYCITTGC